MRNPTVSFAAAVLFSFAAYSPLINIAFADNVGREIALTVNTNLKPSKRYTFRFSLWDQVTDGAKLWSETKAIKLNNKTLEHRLGSVDPVTNPLSTDFFKVQLWLQVERQAGSGWSPLGARTQLAQDAYAFLAFEVEEGAIDSESIEDGSIATLDIKDGAITDAKIAGPISASKLDSTIATTGQISSSVESLNSTITTHTSRTDNPHAVTAAQVGASATSHTHDDRYLGDSAAASGDLTGSYPSPVVAKLQGLGVSSTAPSSGQVLKWNGSQWAPAADADSSTALNTHTSRTDNPHQVTAGQVGASAAAHTHDERYLGSSAAAAGDLSGTFPSPVVSKLQGLAVSSTAPSSNQILKWNGSQWAPAADADSSVALNTHTARTDNPHQVTAAQVGASTTGHTHDERYLANSASAGGDLTGAFPSPVVAKIQGLAVSSTAPSSNQILKWNGSQWAPGADADSGGDITGITAGNGLTGGGTSGGVSLAVNYGGTGSATAVSRSDHGHYSYTVIVSPVGSAVENGTALVAALNAITASAGNPYLLKIEPGVYDLGTSPLTLKSYVDIEGCGQNATKITRSGSASSSTGTVIGANNTEVRFLTIENTGGNTFATGIYNAAASSRFKHVTVSAGGATNINAAIRDDSGAASYSDLVLNASGGTIARGSEVSSSASSFFNVSMTVSGASSSNRGIYGTGSARFDHITATISGGINSAGVELTGGTPVIADSTLRVSGASSYNYGVRLQATAPAKLYDSHITVSASESAYAYGVYSASSTASANVHNCTIEISGGSNSSAQTAGFRFEHGANLKVEDCDVNVAGGGNVTIGISLADTDSVVARGALISVTGPEARGVTVNSGTPVELQDVNAVANGTGVAYGLSVIDSAVTANHCAFEGRTGTTTYGVLGGGTATIQLNNSKASGASATLRGEAGVTIQAGSSQLSGGAASPNGGTISCVGTYDENFANVGYTTCP